MEGVCSKSKVSAGFKRWPTSFMLSLFRVHADCPSPPRSINEYTGELSGIPDAVLGGGGGGGGRGVTCDIDKASHSWLRRLAIFQSCPMKTGRSSVICG